MKPLSPDTNFDIQRMHFEMVRQVPESKRLGLAFALTQALRELTLANIRLQFPQASEEEVRKRFIARVLPAKLVRSAYGFDPTEEDIDCG